jgi:hypothetical protein
VPGSLVSHQHGLAYSGDREAFTYEVAAASSCRSSRCRIGQQSSQRVRDRRGIDRKLLFRRTPRYRERYLRDCSRHREPRSHGLGDGIADAFAVRSDGAEH